MSPWWNFYCFIFTLKYFTEFLDEIGKLKHGKKSGADSGFHRGGANPKRVHQSTMWPIFIENCMKMKKDGPRGWGVQNLTM